MMPGDPASGKGAPEVATINLALGGWKCRRRRLDPIWR